MPIPRQPRLPIPRQPRLLIQRLITLTAASPGPGGPGPDDDRYERQGRFGAAVPTGARQNGVYAGVIEAQTLYGSRSNSSDHQYDSIDLGPPAVPVVDTSGYEVDLAAAMATVAAPQLQVQVELVDSGVYGDWEASTA